MAEIDRIGRLQRFLAPQVAKMIASADSPEAMLASHRREVTVVFCDLRGFTAFTERSEPEEVMVVLRDYHESLGELIFRYEGTLDRFAGDGIMIIFNDPIPCDDHTERAVQLALDMRDQVGKAVGRSGSARATSSASGSALRRATRRSGRSVSSTAANTPPSAASSIWRPGCATRRGRVRS